MRIIWAYGDEEVPGYEGILSRYPEKEFYSPFRSTVPHLMFWRNAETRFHDLCRFIGERPFESARASFEFQVKPPRGRGKPSHTDLMLTWDDHCAAVEAKYTEPKYETVAKWLEHGQHKNRLEVLKGWCDLLPGNTGTELTLESVSQIAYQVLHRAASACSMTARVRYLIYEVFEPKMVGYYSAQIRELVNLLKPLSIHGFILNVPINPSEEYKTLKTRWEKGNRQLYPEVLEGLRLGTLMSFGKPEVIEIR